MVAVLLRSPSLPVTPATWLPRASVLPCPVGLLHCTVPWRSTVVSVGGCFAEPPCFAVPRARLRRHQPGEEEFSSLQHIHAVVGLTVYSYEYVLSITAPYGLLRGPRCVDTTTSAQHHSLVDEPVFYLDLPCSATYVAAVLFKSSTCGMYKSTSSKPRCLIPFFSTFHVFE